MIDQNILNSKADIFLKLVIPKRPELSSQNFTGPQNFFDGWISFDGLLKKVKTYRVTKQLSCSGSNANVSNLEDQVFKMYLDFGDKNSPEEGLYLVPGCEKRDLAELVLYELLASLGVGVPRTKKVSMDLLLKETTHLNLATESPALRRLFQGDGFLLEPLEAVAKRLRRKIVLPKFDEIELSEPVVFDAGVYLESLFVSAALKVDDVGIKPNDDFTFFSESNNVGILTEALPDNPEAVSPSLLFFDLEAAHLLDEPMATRHLTCIDAIDLDNFKKSLALCNKNAESMKACRPVKERWKSAEVRVVQWGSKQPKHWQQTSLMVSRCIAELNAVAL